MWLCALLLSQAGGLSPADGLETRLAPFLREHCIECHAGARPKGELDLSALLEAAAADGLAAWREPLERVRERVLADEMPPASRPRPPLEQVERSMKWLELELDSKLATTSGLRRLNRSEYERAIRDLFGIGYPARELFPPEDVGALFDNDAAVASASELAVERWVEAAERVAWRALPAEVENSVREYGVDALDVQGGGSKRGREIGLSSVGLVKAAHEFPRAGRYRIEVSGYADLAGPELPRLVFEVDGQACGQRELSQPRGGTQTVGVEVDVEAGTRELAARFVNDFYDPKNPDPKGRDRNVHIVDMVISGPLDATPTTEFTRWIDGRLADTDFSATLASLGLRVWRRPLTAEELTRLIALSASEDAPRERLRAALVALLASPNFIYRVEVTSVGQSLNSFELATRLSFFLWASVPDETLLAAAQRGELSTPSARNAQVQRMLRDPRSRSLVEEFAAQWLGWRSLERSTPDPLLFPMADAALLSSMRQESEAFFEAMLREARPLDEFLAADFAFVDERLAVLYGIEGVRGEGVRRVPVHAAARGGLLGQAALLTATSNPTRTSPVKRGKWILETLMGKSVPPPPPGVGVLDEKKPAGSATTMREQLDLHRGVQECASCHLQLDPLGFALEGFDAIGRKRSRDGEFAVDDRAELADGRALDGASGLVRYLIDSGEFPRALANALFSYALGRAPNLAERRELRDLVERLPAQQRTLPELIERICSHSAFGLPAPH